MHMYVYVCIYVGLYSRTCAYTFHYVSSISFSPQTYLAYLALCEMACPQRRVYLCATLQADAGFAWALGELRYTAPNPP